MAVTKTQGTCNSIQTSVTISRIKCGVLCANHGACSGFNFRLVTSKCSLVLCNLSQNDGSLQSDPEYSYFKKVI